MTGALARGAERVVLAIRILAGVLLMASVAINFANVVGRYFFNVSISWAEEIMLFLMVGSVFCGIAVVAWAGRQIRMDVFVRLMPESWRRITAAGAELLFVAAAAVVVAFAVPVVEQLAAFDERSTAANVPLAIPQSMLPIGFAVAAVLVLIRLLAGGRPAAPASGAGSVADPE